MPIVQKFLSKVAFALFIATLSLCIWQEKTGVAATLLLEAFWSLYSVPFYLDVFTYLYVW
jgi:hypothetical protein